MHLFVMGKLFRQKLKGDESLEACVFLHDTHAALAYFCQDAVVGDGIPDERARVPHIVQQSLVASLVAISGGYSPNTIP